VRIARVGIVFLAAVLFAQLLYITCVNYITQWPEGPSGCDAFGYLRQAQLIRERGPVRGLDTAITKPVAEALVRAAKETGFPASAWYLAVAPGCTYYNEHTDRIVLQYPPGTGMIYSIFPEGIEVRATAIASATFLFLLSSIAAFYIRSWKVALGVLSAGALSVVTLTHEGNGLSVWPSMFAAAIAAWLTVKALDTTQLKPSLAWLAVLGFVCGIAINIRLANSFILFGILAAMALVNRHRAASMALLLLAAGVGALPTFAGNWINAGSPFRPTYPNGTEGMQVFQWDWVWDYNLKFYITAGWSSVLLGAFAAGTIITIVLWRRLPLWLPLALLLNFAFSVVFFLTHVPHQSYYFAHVSTWGLYTCIFTVFSRARDKLEAHTPALLSAAAVGFTIFMLVHLRFAQTSLIDTPQIDFSPEPNSVFWTANPAGYLVYFDIAYGATVMNADAPTRQALIKAVREKNIPQYFVADTPEISSIIVDEGSQMERVGHLFGFEVYHESHKEKVDR
jgi:hypothetical protein